MFTHLLRCQLHQLLMKEVHFYKTELGECPISEFLNSLAAQKAQKVLWVLQLIEDAPAFPPQYFQKLTNAEDIWEIGIHLGNDIFRILGFEDKQQFVLNHAFQNPTQKTQLLDEIKIAELHKQDYFNRKLTL